MEIILEPGRADKDYWRDVWRYRELFQVLAWRDIAVRYKQTFIGVAWAVVRPVLTMVIFTFVFGRVARLPSEGGAPYALMVFAGMLPWTFFATALSDASNSLTSNANLVSRVYFPRVIVPAASVVVAVVDFLISFVILAAMMAWYQFQPDWRVVWLPAYTVMAFGAALGAGLWIAALNVRYRDFRYVIPFIAQFGLYLSPVGFSSSVLPESWRLLYSLNPMVGVIDGFRWSLLRGQTAMSWPGFTVSLAAAVAFLWIGIRRFRRTERMFADVI